MSELAGNIRGVNLSAAKRALLEQRLKSTRLAESISCPISSRPNKRRAPISLAQEGMLRAYAANGRVTYYLRAMRLKGEFNVHKFTDTVTEIVRRHESLRTTFAIEDGGAVQIVSEQPMEFLNTIDVTGIPAGERKEIAWRLAKTNAETPLDPFTDPVVRIAFFRLGSDDYTLVMALSHMMFDRWSLGLFMRELAILYQAYGIGTPSPLPGLKVQFGDVACWQIAHSKRPAVTRDLSYWREQLKGAPPGQSLPTDRRRPAVESFVGEKQVFTLSKETTTELRDLSHKEEATIFTTFASILSVLLYQHTWEPDTMIQFPTANRHWVEVEDVIGPFVGNIVLRLDASGNPTFRELLKRVKTLTVEALAHQATPLEVVRDEIGTPEAGTSSAVYQVVFGLQSGSNDGVKLPDVEMTPLLVRSDTILYDLLLEVVDGSEGLTCSFTYKTDLFNRDSASVMLLNLKLLCERVAKNSEVRVLDLPSVGRSSLMLEPDFCDQ